MSDLIINAPGEIKLIRVVKDAEACSICGGTRPELVWTGKSMVHIQCAKDARSAAKINGKPAKGLSVDDFMVTLATHERVVQRLFGRRK